MNSPLDTSLLDARMSGNDIVQRKRQMDALKERLGDQRTHDERLREAVEGFEAIFVQKMWQQMRANVPKEGYLHSKNEEMWQSMYDQELSKKMTEAGGIGLSDMLYEQLKSKLDDASRASSPGRVVNPVPVNELSPSDRIQTYYVSDEGMDDMYAPFDENSVRQVDPNAPDVEEMPPAFSEDDATVHERVNELAERIIAEGDPAGVQRRNNDTQAAGSAEELDTAAGSGASVRSDAVNFENEKAPRAADAAALEAERKEAERAAQAELSALNNGNNNVTRPAGSGSAIGDTTSAQGIAAASDSESVQGAGGPLASLGGPGTLNWPLPGRITSDFGWRNDPFTGEREWHAGIDIGGNIGDPVSAAWDGKVAFAGEKDGYGNLVVLEHEGGWRSYYAHAEDIDVEVGQIVSSGSKIATVGNTGRSTGPHLHFEIRQGELAWNPRQIRTRLMAGLSIGKQG